MTLENSLAIAGFVLVIVCYIGYRYFSENVCLKYKEQRVGLNNKKGGTNK